MLKRPVFTAVFFILEKEHNLLQLLVKATVSVIRESRFSGLGAKKIPTDVDGLLRFLDENSMTEYVLAEAALDIHQGGKSGSSKRNSIEFNVNSSRSSSELLYTQNSAARWGLDATTIKNCLIGASRVTERLQVFSSLYEFDLFELLGLRNLSALMGEIFAKQVLLAHRDKFLKNQNQDGYPDLCALTPESRTYLKKLTDSRGKINTDKRYWSPYPYGGVEVKATCGNTPVASIKPKPAIGMSRIETGLVSAEWKAHHRETKSLLGVYWDFVETLPTFLAAFYRNDLTVDDWGNMVVPREDSHATSVSVMKRSGVKRMGEGWMVLPKDDFYLKPLSEVFGVPKPVPV